MFTVVDRELAGGFHAWHGWHFSRMVNVSAGENWCQVSLHCQVRITATITRGIQAVLSVTGTAVYHVEWSDTGPFYLGIPSLTVVCCGKLLSFSTRVVPDSRATRSRLAPPGSRNYYAVPTHNLTCVAHG